MRADSIAPKEARLISLSRREDSPNLRERHRIFPEVFTGKNHQRTLNSVAGVGIIGKTIKDGWNVQFLRIQEQNKGLIHG